MTKRSPASRQQLAWKEPELTEVAERVYRKLAQNAGKCIERGDHANSKVTLFRMIDDAITKLIPHDPLDPQRALSGPLANIFRLKKGRFRICYIASSEQRRIVVLYISETLRKSGDMADPYNVFTKPRLDDS